MRAIVPPTTLTLVLPESPLAWQALLESQQVLRRAAPQLYTDPEAVLCEQAVEEYGLICRRYADCPADEPDFAQLLAVTAATLAMQAFGLLASETGQWLDVLDAS